MKNLNKKDIELIKYLIIQGKDTAEDNAYIESKKENKRAVERIEKYIKELEKLYKKL